MPTYAYECPKCKQVVELVQKMSEKKNPNCSGEQCQGVQMESVLSLSTFILKGTGWARDGYK
jgi:putative FmdB family regulatory protein